MNVTNQIVELQQFLEKTTVRETAKLFFVISFLLLVYICVIVIAPVVVFLPLL